MVNVVETLVGESGPCNKNRNFTGSFHGKETCSGKLEKKDYNVLIGDSIQNESDVGIKKNLWSSIFFTCLVPPMSSEINFFSF